MIVLDNKEDFDHLKLDNVGYTIPLNMKNFARFLLTTKSQNGSIRSQAKILLSVVTVNLVLMGG